MGSKSQLKAGEASSASRYRLITTILLTLVLAAGVLNLIALRSPSCRSSLKECEQDLNEEMKEQTRLGKELNNCHLQVKSTGEAGVRLKEAENKLQILGVELHNAKEELGQVTQVKEQLAKDLAAAQSQLDELKHSMQTKTDEATSLRSWAEGQNNKVLELTAQLKECRHVLSTIDETAGQELKKEAAIATEAAA